MDKKDIPENESDKPEKVEKSDLKQNTTQNPEIKKVENNTNNQEMEVHVKHNSHKESSIKLFLYEFFIIFLAVSLSFIVENIRERYIEHHKEMQYVKSLINDIQLDTAQLTSSINFNRKQLCGIDTLLREMDNPGSKKVVNYLYYYSFNYINGLKVFAPTDRTISQLKNAGGLRLIQSQTASNSIINYDSKAQLIVSFDNKCFDLLFALIKQQQDLLNFKVRKTKDLNNVLANSNLKLLTGDSKRIDVYYNGVNYFGDVRRHYNEALIELKRQATQLLVTLKKEYKLE